MSNTHSLKVLTYNIHKGFSARNRHYVLTKMRHAIRNIHADIVALQEVQGEHAGHARKYDDWHAEAHFEFLADSVWPHTAYGKNAIYQEGHHGNALISKFPFVSIHNQDISQSSYSRRSILHGQVRPAAKISTPVHIACVHLGFMPLEQYQQTHSLCAWLNSLPKDDPVILLGDFNDWHHRIHRHLCRHFNLQEVSTFSASRPMATYPASNPKIAMDRIYYRGLALSSSYVCTGGEWARLSDHCPVFAEFFLDP